MRWNLVLLLPVLITWLTANAAGPIFDFSFWGQPGPSKFIFTTSPQTLNANACSAIVTVEGVNNANAPIKAPSVLNLYLFGNSAQFFSDSGCTTPITGVSIAAQSTSTSFYFEAQATNPIEASTLPTNVTPAVQTETINAGTAITGFAYTDGSYNGSGNLGYSPYFGYDYEGLSEAVYNGQLYIAPTMSDANYNTNVAVYNGNDAAPNWTLTNGGNPITYNNNGTGAQLMTFGAYLFATWSEYSNTYGQWVIRAKYFDGTNWNAADNGSININNTVNGEGSSFGVYNGNLYITWEENSGPVHVARWAGGTNWTLIDDNGSGGTNGTQGMNYYSSDWAGEPVLYGAVNGLFSVWFEQNQLRVKVFNGTSWSAADSGSGIQADSVNWYNQSTGIATLAELKGETYLSYLDFGSNTNYNAVVRVLVYAGGTTWNVVDPGTYQGLNYLPTSNAGNLPQLIAYQGRLYILWEEADSPTGIVNGVEQARMSVYNGNDSAPLWTPVIGVSTDGMGYIPWANTFNNNANASAVIFNNKLYGGWFDSENIDTGVFTKGTTPVNLWFPTLVNNADNYNTAGCIADEVRTVDANGNPSFVTSPTTVTLSATGVTFYSDQLCSQTIPSNQLTIAAGDSGAHFFLLISSGGDNFTVAVSGSGSGLNSATQPLSNSGDDIWIGGTSCSDENWSDGACWSQGSPPQNNDQTAVFTNSLCSINCSANIDNGAPGAGNLLMETDYTGVITQVGGTTTAFSGVIQVEGGTLVASSSSADTFTTYGVLLNGTGVINAEASQFSATNYFTQNGGTFNADTATIQLGGATEITGGTFNGTNSAMTIQGNFTQSGGTLVCPSGTLNYSGEGTFTITGGTFNANSGLFNVNSIANSTTISSGTASFNNVTLAGTSGGWWAPFTVNGTMNVAGNLIIAGDTSFDACTPGATIAVKGNVTIGGDGNDAGPYECGAGYTTLDLVGTGTQTVTGSPSSYSSPGNFVIDSSGTVDLAGTIQVNNSWIYNSGTVNAGSSTVVLPSANTLTPGNMHFYNLQLGTGGGWQWANTSGTLLVDGDFTANFGGGYITGGSITVQGNFNWISGNAGGAAVNFVGGNKQTLSMGIGALPNGDITVNKTAGSALWFDSPVYTVGFPQTFGIQSGSVILNGNSLNVGYNNEASFSMTGAGSLLDCDCGCGAGTACNQGPDLSCGTFSVTGGATVSTCTSSTQLAFTTPPQTLSTWQCAMVTVQNQDALGQGTIVTSPLQVNLANSGTGGVTFYSDSLCTQPVTNVNIPANFASMNFYINSSLPGTDTITATASGVSQAQQTETFNLAPFTWIGGTTGTNGCDGNFTTHKCWSGSNPPGINDTANFDANCTQNCSPTISGTVDIGGVWLNNNYTGTIDIGSQSFTAENFLEVDAKTFNVDSGTLIVGSNGSTGWGANLVLTGGTLEAINGAVTMGANGNFSTLTMAGGTFDAPSGTLYLNGNINLSGTYTFNVNGGTLTLFPNNSNNPIFSTGSTAFNNVIFNGNCWSGPTIMGTMYINGDLTMNETHGGGCDGGDMFALGTLSLAGNLYLNQGNSGTGSANITFTGGNSQVVSGGGILPYGTITVAKTVGTSVQLQMPFPAINPGQAFNVQSGSLDLNGQSLSGGFAFTVGATGSLLLQGGEAISNSSNSFDPASVVSFYGTSNYSSNPLDTNWGTSFGFLTFNGAGGTWISNSPLAIASDLVVTAGTFNANSQALTIGGSLSGAGTFSTPGLVTFDTSSGATVNSTASFTNGVTVDKAGGSLTLDGGVTTLTGQTFAITGGSISLNGQSVNVGSGGSGGTIDVGAGTTLNCNGECGTAPITSCSQNSSTGLICKTLTNSGTINQ